MLTLQSRVLTGFHHDHLISDPDYSGHRVIFDYTHTTRPSVRQAGPIMESGGRSLPPSVPAIVTAQRPPANCPSAQRLLSGPLGLPPLTGPSRVEFPCPPKGRQAARTGRLAGSQWHAVVGRGPGTSGLSVLVSGVFSRRRGERGCEWYGGWG